MHKRILVPLDGSDFSEAVLPHAMSLAQGLGAEIVLLHVFPEPAAEFDTAALHMQRIGSALRILALVLQALP